MVKSLVSKTSASVPAAVTLQSHETLGAALEQMPWSKLLHRLGLQRGRLVQRHPSCSAVWGDRVPLPLSWTEEGTIACV